MAEVDDIAPPLQRVSAIRVLLLGDSGVGKSTLLSRLAAGPTNPLPSIVTEPVLLSLRPQLRRVERTFLSLCTLDSEILLRGICTPQYELDAAQTLLDRANVVVLCYSIASPLTLANVQETWRQMLAAGYNSNESVGVMMLGMKRDLRKTRDQNEWRANEKVSSIIVHDIVSQKSRALKSNIKIGMKGENMEKAQDGELSVMPQEGLSIARMLRLDGYAECSSVTGELIREVWEDLVGMCLKVQKSEGETSRAQQEEGRGWGECGVM